MEDFVHPQIREICKLKMPEGLKELMSDISREVLRAQPTEIYSFISNYLAALLVSRDNLYISNQICASVSQCDCRPELCKHLMDIGMCETDAKTTANVIFKYFMMKNVDEANLLATLVRKTNIDRTMYPSIVDAVRAAYIIHQTHNSTKYETSSDSDQDEVAVAVAHTLRLYRDTSPPPEEYSEMSNKVQKSYRAYGVRRNITPKSERVQIIPEFDTASTDSSFSDSVKKEMQITTSLNEKRISTESSFSLAGSLYKLPKHKPYNAHDEDSIIELEESCDQSHVQIDYTGKSPNLSIVEEKESEIKAKGISFQTNPVEETRKSQNAEKNRVSIMENSDKYEKETEYEDESIEEALNYVEDGDEGNDEGKLTTVFEYVNTINKDVDTESDDTEGE